MKLSDFEKPDGTPNVKFIKKFYKKIEEFLLSKTADKERRKEIKNKIKQLKKEIVQWVKLLQRTKTLLLKQLRKS